MCVRVCACVCFCPPTGLFGLPSIFSLSDLTEMINQKEKTLEIKNEARFFCLLSVCLTVPLSVCLSCLGFRLLVTRIRLFLSFLFLLFFFVVFSLV